MASRAAEHAATMITEGDARLVEVRKEAELAAHPLLAQATTIAMLATILGEEEGAQDPEQVDKLPSGLAEAARAFIETRGLENIVQPGPYWVVIAEALALQTISGTASGARVANQRRCLGESPAWVYDVWIDACRRLLAALDAPQRSAWLDELGRMPAIEREGENATRAVVVLRASAAWSVADSFQLWTEDPVAFRAVASWTPLNLLHRYDAFLWLGAVDKWPDMRLVHGALFSAGARETEHEFIGFFRIARPCFAGDGSPTDACAGVILCESAIQHAQRGFDNTSEGGKAQTLNFLHRVAHAVLQRADGTTLLLALAAKAADAALLTDNTHRIPSPVPALAWAAFSASLIGAAVPVAAQRLAHETRLRRAPDEHGAVRRTLPALIVALRTLGERRGPDGAALLAWLETALRSPTEWTSKATMNYLLEVIVDVLLLAERPIESCREMFVAMEPVRRRWEFSKHYLEHHGELPSLLLLVAFTNLVLRGCSPQPERDLAFARDRALRLALTNATSGEPALRAREVVALTLTAACSMFGAADPRTETLARPFAQDREVLGHLLHRLAQSDDPSAIERLMLNLGRTPDEVVANATEWAEATGHPFDRVVAEVTTAALRRSAEPTT